MNLVQINERLKDLPMQAVQQYANGANPEVPAYLALAELQRREKQMQQQNVAQGAAQGQPSIKEQIEQKSGLMALQQGRIQQQQQQMMKPQPTGPVPPNVPPAEPQPEVEMARGGVARLPVRSDLYQFANGGIIAFQAGKQVPKVISVPANTSEEEIRKIQSQNPNAVVKREGAPKAAMPKGADYQRSPMFEQAYAVASQEPQAPTPESVVAGIAALTPKELSEEGRQSRYQAAEQRASDLERQYEQSKPSGLDRLIEVFGQAGQYKGLSGLGPAYTRQKQGERARDLAFRQKQNEARTAMDKAQAEEAGGIFEARSKDFAAQNEAFRRQLAARTESLASLAGTDQRAMDAALNRLSDMELEKIRSTVQTRPTEAERIIAHVLKLRSQGKNAEAQQYLDLVSQAKGGSGVAGLENAETRSRRQEMAELQVIMENKMGAFSMEEEKAAAKRYAELARLNPAPASATASKPAPGNTRMRFDAQGNLIK